MKALALIALACLGSAGEFAIESDFSKLPTQSQVPSVAFTEHGVKVSISGYYGTISVADGLISPDVGGCDASDEKVAGIRVSFSEPMSQVEVLVRPGVEPTNVYIVVNRCNWYGYCRRSMQPLMTDDGLSWSGGGYTYPDIVAVVIEGGASLDYMRVDKW